MGSTFIRRLKYYGIGFGIGIIVITFILPNRGCSWTPANRVKNMILGRLITVNEAEWKYIQSKGLTKEDVLSVLNDGSLNFGDSQKDGGSKVYVIDKKIKNKGEFRFYFTLPEESFISEVKIGEVDAKKVLNTTEGYGRFLSVPNDEYLIYPDSTAKVSCQMEKLNITSVKSLYKDMVASGRINFSKTTFETRPKPEHYIEFVSDNDTIGIQSVWYKNKIFVSNFESKKVTDCK